jgi:UDPglucose 6-dehydrogenase
MWGLSFKPNTDDMREAPSLVLIDKILSSGGKVVAYDPVASHEAQRILGEKITYVSEPYEALNHADALLVVTEWAEFKVPDFDKISSLMKNKIIFDGRNIYDKKEMSELGYEYHCIGSK